MTYDEEQKKLQEAATAGKETQTASTAQATQQGLQQQDQTVAQAGSYLQSVIDGNPGQYQSTYAPQIKDLYDQVMHRGKYQYNVNADPVYQALKGQAVNMGQRAMQDSIAQGAALSAGYGNSYSQAAGQQGYQDYLTTLLGYIPQLEEQGYQRHAQEGADLQKLLALTQGLEEQEYARYMDSVENYWQGQSMQLNQKESAFNQALTLMQMGITPNDELLAQAGLTAEDVKKYLSGQNSGGGSGGGSGNNVNTSDLINAGAMIGNAATNAAENIANDLKKTPLEKAIDAIHKTFGISTNKNTGTGAKTENEKVLEAFEKIINYE